MPTRTAEATWEGPLREGEGTVAFGSGAYEGTYSFASRFEDGSGTNPEELLGAAEAGCLSMATALALEEAGHTPRRIHTEADVHLERVNGDFAITSIELSVEGAVPDAEEAAFVEQVRGAKEDCPVSQALAGTDIELTAELVDATDESEADGTTSETTGEDGQPSGADSDSRGERIKRALDMHGSP